MQMWHRKIDIGMTVGDARTVLYDTSILRFSNVFLRIQAINQNVRFAS